MYLLSKNATEVLAEHDSFTLIQLNNIYSICNALSQALQNIKSKTQSLKARAGGWSVLNQRQMIEDSA